MSEWRRWIAHLPALVAGLAVLGGFAPAFAQGNAPATVPSEQAAGRSGIAQARGKKLVLKDGSFHLVREYRKVGDRVQFYSMERSEWEEVPADLVDWAATEQAEADRQHAADALAAKVKVEEDARKAVFVDVDASLEVAPGVFLPDGEGIFALDGNKVFALTQAETDVKLNKSQVAKQILVPIPIVPSRHTISLLGEHAKTRTTNGQLEFYMRSKDGHTPDVVLIRARARGGNRQIENIDRLFGEEMAKRQTIPIERWELVKGVTRFTLSQTLPPGEYAVAEIMRGSEEDLYVWDFGVDAVK